MPITDFENSTVSKPKVSCLMPAYNAERYVCAAIDSVILQTLGNFELIIVNDESVDSTASILDEYARKDSRIKVIHERHGGVVSALNKGLAYCTADYVARMDADDICAPHRFAVQAEYLDAHPHCVCVGGLFMNIDETGAHHGIYRYSRNRATSLKSFPVRVALTCHPLAMLRRSVLSTVGGYRNTFPHAEDYDLFLRIAEHGTVENPEEVLLYYRTHSKSVSWRNLEVQEAEAAYAELDALLAHRGQPNPAGPAADYETARREIDQFFPKWLTEPYIRFRIWRRLVSIDPERASMLKGKVLCSALSLDVKTLLSRDYWGLRIRMLGGLLLWGSATLQGMRKRVRT
jgi:GT2 family glycosyltransferase